MGKVLGVIVCICVIIGSILAVIISVYLVNATKNDEALLNLNNIKLSFTTILYAKDEDGQYVEYQRLNGEEHRIWVNLQDMTPYLPQAFIAVEDNTFYKHHGVNWKRSVAAALNEGLGMVGLNLFSNRQGGSTITQQLVKNLTGDEKQDAMRKVREMFRAMVLEKQYSKDLILEAYLNTLRLTGKNAGVESGANVYFGKSVSELSLAECASLAAITKNPSQYNPFTNPEEHLSRRNYILDLMLKQKMISQEEHDAAQAEPLNLADSSASGGTIGTNSYFTDKVINDVITDLISEKGYTKQEATNYLYNGGLRIYTTVVPKLQAAMENEMENGTAFPDRTHMVDVLDENGNKTGQQTEEHAQAAMISLTYDGGIAACVGGLGEKSGDRILNRATDSVRQVGSAMKPIAAYCLGIDYNYITYSSALLDSPIQIRDPDTGQMVDWPQNYNKIWSNTDILVTDAIARSLNTIAVKVGQMVGTRVMYDFVKDTLHVTSLDEKKDVDLSPMVLGGMTHGISPLEMAAAYMMFGNEGKYSTVHSYTSVEDTNGNVVLEKTVTTTQAISPEAATIMNHLLERVLQPGGTGNGLAPNRMSAVGKTGTTSDNKDHWFVGLTPYYVTATWWGYDTPDELIKFSYSTHPPTTAWRNVMNVAQATLPWKGFEYSENVEKLTYCKVSGDLAGPNCTETAEGYYKPEKKPGTCILH